MFIVILGNVRKGKRTDLLAAEAPIVSREELSPAARAAERRGALAAPVGCTACQTMWLQLEYHAVGDLMHTMDVASALTRLFSELVDGASGKGGGFILNSGDAGLLRALDALSAAEASRSVNDGATIAAHAQHVRYGLSLMTRWATEGGDPFADATWDEAWKTVDVDAPTWKEIRNGLRDEAGRWLMVLGTSRDVNDVELTGMIASIAHLAYHLGAIRQIDRNARGPREGTFS